SRRIPLMAYDEGLAQRVRESLDQLDTPSDEKKMFGGIAFMVNGHMSVGITGADLMVRVGADQYTASLTLPHAREMDFTGKALKGFVYVAEDGLGDDESLLFWIERALGFVRQLPPK
ncbi:MAG: TfoX/Sxy family protein, partial [bacterium]